MPWKAARPQGSTGDVEYMRLLQEMYDRRIFGSFSWTPPAVGANSSAGFLLGAAGPDIVSTIANGMRPGAAIAISPPAILSSGATVYGLCAVNDSVTVVIVNPTAAPITPPAGTWGMAGMVT